MTHPTFQIEYRIASEARAFLKVHPCDDYDIMAGYQRSISGDLARLLDACLQADPTRNWDYLWVDDLLDGRFSDISADGLAVTGLIIWASTGRASYEWLAPFEASFRIDEPGEYLRSYRLCFGEKTGEGELARTTSTRSYRVRDAMVTNRPRGPDGWWFVFDKLA